MADDILFAEQTAPLSFAEFLERMKEPAAADLVRSIKNFIKTFDDRPPDPDRDALSVQSFLVKSEAAFKQHPVWANVPPAHQAQAVEGLEKYLMTKIYHKVFAVSELDRERDESLTMRMSALGFIEPKHLDIPELYHDEKAWILARKELHKINNYKAPRDKLVCALNCCRVINNLLHVQVQGEARGADDFLPVLIYVVIHANPPQLASNLEYIQRFRMHSRMASESAYFFTQLYSAASFIETVNATSLTIDPDEFMARMVAAGVPDMQLVPSSAAMPLITRTSNSSIADALAASQNPPPLDDQALMAEAAEQMQQSPAAGAAAMGAASIGVSEAAAQIGGESFMGIPAGAPMTISALPLAGQAGAGMLLTHNSEVESSATAVSDVQKQMQAAQPPQHIEQSVPASGDKAPAALEYAAAQAAMPAQPVPLPGADAASSSLAPQAAIADEPLPESSLPMATGSAAVQSMQYPSVADLERAGTELLLQAEASGRLKEQHTFLYAMAADLRVLDVDKLLSHYKELVLRYEALSLAAAQLHMHSQPTGPSSQPAAASSLHGSQPAAAPATSQQQPSAQLAGMGRNSPSHLLASRQPEKAHEPMFGAAQPAGDAGAASSGMLAHLQEASDTAHDAAEAVLQPQTSAAFYDEQAGVGSQALPPGSSAAAAQQAQPLAEDDRFLSLARGEAQADATDVGTPPAEAPRAAHAAPASAEQQPDAVVDGGPSTHHQQHPDDLPRESQPGQDGPAGNQAPRQDASSRPIEVPPAGYAGDDKASICQQGEPPDLPPVPRASGRKSISSTEATLGRDNAEWPAAEVSPSPVENDGALPSEILVANPAFAAGAASAAAPDKEAAGAGQGNGAVGGSSGGPAPQGAAPEHAAPESEESSAAANGGPHGAATSNDVDPFAETDAALHSNAESEKGSERAVSPQEAGSDLDGKPRATEEPPGAEDMFGGLTLTGGREGDSLI